MPKADTWTAEPDVQQLARAIADEHHPHLCDARVVVLMKSKASTRGGKTVLGTARKSTPAERAMSANEPDFIITLAFDEWERLNTHQRRALLDHELCHCDGNSETGWKMRPHDVEEFESILERHGAWKDDLREFCLLARQLDLFKDAPGLRLASGS